ncbi:MAG TPA: OB-fold nucleic acid binding domain-containing protein, partial [Myxococcaceae bacterium]|nr:OB-fold nucleic acid binding domain-containing protein [Myxococcaceae bacterium]
MRAGLTSMGVLSAAALNRARAGSTVQVAGMVIARQRPETAKGLVFMSLEDETGVSNLVVMPDVYDRFRPAARGAPLLRVQGQVERSAQGGVVHVKVSALAALPVEREVDFRSRDFH